MANSVYGGLSSGPGGVQIVIEPPIAFIERQMGELALAMTNLTPLWERLEPVMKEIEATVFETKGHGQWPPLAESTIEQKRKQGYPLDPLVRTGALKQSLTGGDVRITPDSMIFGTDVEYAHWHQDGGTKAGRPPQRKLIDVERVEDRRMIEAAVVGWINLVVRGIWK